MEWDWHERVTVALRGGLPTTRLLLLAARRPTMLPTSGGPEGRNWMLTIQIRAFRLRPDSVHPRNSAEDLLEYCPGSDARLTPTCRSTDFNQLRSGICPK